MSVRTAHAALTAWLDAHPTIEPISASLTRWDYPPQVHLSGADWASLYGTAPARQRHIGGGHASLTAADLGCEVMTIVDVSEDDSDDRALDLARHRDATIRDVRASR